MLVKIKEKKNNKSEKNNRKKLILRPSRDIFRHVLDILFTDKVRLESPVHYTHTNDNLLMHSTFSSSIKIYKSSIHIHYFSCHKILCVRNFNFSIILLLYHHSSIVIVLSETPKMSVLDSMDWFYRHVVPFSSICNKYSIEYSI